jgi:hypothetical protein
MNDKKVIIEEEVQKTIEQLDTSEKLIPDPYFYSKIKSRLENSGKQKKSINIILKPAMLILLIIFNVTTIFWYTNKNSPDILENRQNQLSEILSGDLYLSNNQQSIFFEN